MYGSLNVKVIGEAIRVDFPNGKSLWALLSAPNDKPYYATTYALSAFSRVDTRIRMRENIARDIALLKNHSEKIELSPQDYPALAKSEISERRVAVTAVNPNDLASSFGEGVHLKRITLQITSDPVTRSSQKKLQALGIDEFWVGRPGAGSEPWSLPSSLNLFAFVRDADR